MVLLANLELTDCSETIENVSISQSEKVKVDSKADKSNFVDGKFIRQYQHRSSVYSGASLKQYYDFMKNRLGNKKKTGGKYYIPHFVGVNGYPCFPVSEAYARHVLIVFKPWIKTFPNQKSWLGDFHRFINSRSCPASAKLTYERVMQRHYNGTTFVDPSQKTPDYSSNSISPNDAKELLLCGLCGEKASDYDTFLLKSIDRGLSHQWDKKPSVS